jgi:transcriptional regulator with XRE-family HTH domain
MADEIWALRRRAGMTQQELADKLGVGPATIANWERSRSDPSAYQLIRLAKVFAVDPREIVLPLAEKRGTDAGDR